MTWCITRSIPKKWDSGIRHERKMSGTHAELGHGRDFSGRQKFFHPCFQAYKRCVSTKVTCLPSWPVVRGFMKRGRKKRYSWTINDWMEIMKIFVYWHGWKNRNRFFFLFRRMNRIVFPPPWNVQKLNDPCPRTATDVRVFVEKSQLVHYEMVQFNDGRMKYYWHRFK